MRLLIIGSLNGQLTSATKIAMDKGALVTHAADNGQALAVLRSGRGADLLMVDVAINIRDLVAALEAERIHAPIVACGTATDARAADITQLPYLLHGQEREVFGDQAYWKEADRQAFELRGVRYRINRRPNRRPLSERWRMINRARSRTRACGEHAFRVVKQLWGFAKARYRGLAKNLARAQTMFALANLYQLRRELLPAGTSCLL